MFAVIKTGGKQYLVSPDKTLKTEKLTPDDKNQVVFDKVLLIADGDKVELGHPTIEGAQVVGRVGESARDKKIIVLKYKAKTRYKKKMGHRQTHSKVEIAQIVGGGK